MPFDLKKSKVQNRLLIRRAAEPFLPKKSSSAPAKDTQIHISELEWPILPTRLRTALEGFRSNPTWAYLVDFDKVERAFEALSSGGGSQETDVLDSKRNLAALSPRQFS